MQKGIVIHPSNVVDITLKMFFMNISDIKPQYTNLALIYTNTLIDAWYAYCYPEKSLVSQKHIIYGTENNLKNLIDAVNALVGILKIKSKKQLVQKYSVMNSSILELATV